ncbi:MAG: acyl-CoA thioesterase [Chloroflexota bacterium]
MAEHTILKKVPRSHTIAIRVRHSDIDIMGHVNNAVYLQYVMEAAFQHAESAGFTMDRMREMGGGWVVRRAEIEYLRPARAGDELLVTTTLAQMRGLRATRETKMVDAATKKVIATASTDYIWINHQGRPTHIPAEALAAFDLSDEGGPA